MRWFRVIADEVSALFVDDGSFAIAILAWPVLAGLSTPRLGLTPMWQGVVLFAGLAALLVARLVQHAQSKESLR